MDIVETLRERYRLDPTVQEAADEIERLREQVEFERASLRSAFGEMRKLDGDIERLRGLLKNWVDCCFVNFATDTIEIVDVGKVYVETRAALKGEE